MSIQKGFVAFVFLLGFLSIAACGDDENDNNCIKGEGTITTSTLSVANFSGVDLGFSSNVTINQGSTQTVQATGHPNIIEKITTSTVANGIWDINLDGGCYQDYELAIEITVPNINQLILSGSGNLVVNDFSNQSELEMDLSGSGDITLNGFEGITNLNVTLSGSGNITGNNDISTLETCSLVNSGSGRYQGFAINSGSYTVNSSGSGNTEITVQNTLDVTLSGSGNVSYKGMPTITENVTGSGSLIDAN